MKRTINQSFRATSALIIGLVSVLAVGLAPTPAAAAKSQLISRSLFGVTDHQPAVAGAAGWPRARVGSIRLWDTGVSWRELEVAPGRFNFATLDQVVRAARSHRARPLLVLGQTPAFHAVHPSSPGFYGRGATSMPRLAAWKKYVAVLARRYGSAVDYQIWNEPNVIGMWRGTPQQMASLTSIASHIVNTWAPKAKVVGPSFPVRLAAQRSWVGRFYAQRVGGARVGTKVDVVSLNLYPAEVGSPETSMTLLRTMRSVLARDGVRKPIWNTEINYGMTGDGSRARKISTTRQAANVARTYLLNASSGVRKVFWYSWDLHALGNTEVTKRNNATVTPAGRAYNTVAAWLIGHRLRGCSVSGGTHTCTVGASGSVLRIYWNPSRTVTVHVAGSARSRQLATGPSSRVRGGQALRVGYLPVMVRSAR